MSLTSSGIGAATGAGGMEHIVRQQYRASLADLTFNSRPIITSLTIIAGENIQFAHVIVQAVEDQLRNVAPKIKLPVLYLVDSICKNIGNVYVQLFVRNMFATFSNAYSAVDAQDRDRFRKVVVTWKQPAPNSGSAVPLFPALLTSQLESFMANFKDANPITQTVSSIVLQQQIQALLTQKQNAVIMNPKDTASREQIGVLTQLHVHVGNSSLSTSELQMISQTLTTMMTPVQAISPSILQAAAAASKPPVNIPIPSTPLSGLIPGFGSASGREGFGSSDDSDSGATRSSRKVDLIRVKLTNSDISRKFKNAHEILYDPSTLQCKQCGMRFAGTESGRKKNSAHLDWHFRQNKRLREKGRRAVCREWYLDIDTWVAEDSAVLAAGGDAEEGTDKQNIAAFFGTDTADKLAMAENEVAHDIPADGETDLHCGICKEAMEQYCDADDVWMIKNAVKIAGQLFHESCYSMSVDSGGDKRKSENDENENKRMRV
ncbi:hypothetical protein HDU83_009768 [Entophlyctis luteolus]|nr:hypothetical protein HDU83_009768 [Entophlyctis luteolus]